jgi:hypothetical protein
MRFRTGEMAGSLWVGSFVGNGQVCECDDMNGIVVMVVAIAAVAVLLTDIIIDDDTDGDCR